MLCVSFLKLKYDSLASRLRTYHTGIFIELISRSASLSRVSASFNSCSASCFAISYFSRPRSRSSFALSSSSPPLIKAPLFATAYSKSARSFFALLSFSSFAANAFAEISRIPCAKRSESLAFCFCSSLILGSFIYDSYCSSAFLNSASSSSKSFFAFSSSFSPSATC